MYVISHILLAQHSRGESFREGFRSRGATGHDDVLLGLLDRGHAAWPACGPFRGW